MQRSLLANVVLILMSLSMAGNFRPASAAPDAQPRPFASGDVLVSLNSDGGAQVEWHDPQGTYYQTLDASINKGTAAGLAFDTNSQNLYVTNFGGGTISQFDSSGTLKGTFGSKYSSEPESIAFDAKGNAYVGQADGDVLKFDPTGQFLTSYRVALENLGPGWIDLAGDQCTLYYTSGGHNIKSYNVCDDQQLNDFATGLKGDSANAVRWLPDGGLLVADWQFIYRFDQQGTFVTAYFVRGESSWYALALDSDGTSFWGANRNSSTIYKFDLASTKVITSFSTNSGTGVNGLAVIPVSPPAQQPTVIPTLATEAPSTPESAPTPIGPSIPTILIIGGLVLGGIGMIGVIGVIAAVLFFRSRRPTPSLKSPPVQIKTRSHAEIGEEVVITPAKAARSQKPIPAVRLSFDPGQIDTQIEIHDEGKQKGVNS